jgi:adenosylcobinamide-GDP ribazoletransferase
VPYVRASGLGTAASEPRRRGVDLLVGSATAVLVCLADWRHALVAAVLVALVALVVVVVARRRIGGATGDVYGATAELCQLAALLAFTGP